MSFGDNLERIRKDKKVSQAKLGAALGLTQQMVSSYEKGTSSPNIEVLIPVKLSFTFIVEFVKDVE